MKGRTGRGSNVYERERVERLRYCIFLMEYQITVRLVAVTRYKIGSPFTENSQIE